MPIIEELEDNEEPLEFDNDSDDNAIGGLNEPDEEESTKQL